MIFKDYQFKASHVFFWQKPSPWFFSLDVFRKQLDAPSLYCMLHAKGNRDNATGDDDLEDEQNVPWQSAVLMAIRVDWRKKASRETDL